MEIQELNSVHNSVKMVIAVRVFRLLAEMPPVRMQLISFLIAGVRTVE